MKSLVIKTAVVVIGIASVYLAISHQIQAENDAATADIQELIDRACARQKRSGDVSPSCPDSFR
jgi:hypothetical protein